MTKNMNNRYCIQCGALTTYIDKNGHPQWYKKNTDYICKNCYLKIWVNENPEKIHNYNTSKMRFHKKQIQLEKCPRIHTCSKCGKRGKTHLHHYEYDETNPLNYVIELCSSCHAKEHQLGIKIQRINPPRDDFGRYLKDEENPHE